ncbi:DUF5716 family protein [Blautia sp. MSJ-19]|uniref:DUF5716 family protein n=1 Tax=Blautia sp. MSJ-19 TaxID=2841517 RepID=UPI001C0EA593|nr:DUF5716 family protein [Blautia sp. MSJ-19]MBU5479707.1 hypothetical protein [Blautia sp. MSJ-19]
MNETRDLIIGIDFGKKYSQICYYDRKAEEPRSLPVKVGSSQFEMPTCLCFRTEQKDYCVGLEAEYFAREKGGVLAGDLYTISASRDTVSIAGEQKQPWELLAQFLRGMLRMLGVADVEKNTRCLSIAMERLDSVQVENLQRACRELGIPETHCMLMDYEESFFYYAMTQKNETWNRSVAWYSFTQNHVKFRRMSMNAGSRPILVQLEEPVETTLSEEPEARDADFYTFIKSTLGKELYSSIQISGDGFDQEWATKSVKLLCYQRRKAYYGNNLFARGACGAGAERFIRHKLKEYRYMSSAMVLSDVGMDMRVMGTPAYYPLIESGRNWYESSAYVELILDHTKELIFVVDTVGENGKKRIAMALPGLPDRPEKTTRLGVSLQYISQTECQITVKDLGFGELFPASGKEWKETTRWQEGIK